MNPNEPSSQPIATGDRREDVHIVPDADQKFRAEFLRRPDSAPPPDEHTGHVDAGDLPRDTPPVEDLKVAPDSPSVWDARPPSPESSEPSGESGH
jgi:hypothetical protein